jgi:hypothetical protein
MRPGVLNPPTQAIVASTARRRIPQCRRPAAARRPVQLPYACLDAMAAGISSLIQAANSFSDCPDNAGCFDRSETICAYVQALVGVRIPKVVSRYSTAFTEADLQLSELPSNRAVPRSQQLQFRRSQRSRPAPGAPGLSLIAHLPSVDRLQSDARCRCPHQVQPL